MLINYKNKFALTLLQCHSYKKIQKKTDRVSKYKKHTSDIYGFYLQREIIRLLFVFFVTICYNQNAIFFNSFKQGLTTV